MIARRIRIFTNWFALLMHFLCTPPACGGHWYSSLRHLNVVPVLPRTSCSTFAQILLLYIWIEATGLGLWIFKSCAPDSSRNDTCGILDALIISGCHISLSSWQSLFIRKSKFSPLSKSTPTCAKSSIICASICKSLLSNNPPFVLLVLRQGALLVMGREWVAVDLP